MPDITKVDLSRYRFRKAEEMLASAKRDMEADDFASANNRAYYAIFHAMREDFYICSVADTNTLFSGAVTFCKDIGKYLEQRYCKEQGQRQDC